MLTCRQQYMTCLVIHQTKPIDVGVQHAKGFWDWSTYRADTSHLKIHTNFWTHCIYRNNLIQYYKKYEDCYKKYQPAFKLALANINPDFRHLVILAKKRGPHKKTKTEKKIINIEQI